MADTMEADEQALTTTLTSLAPASVRVAVRRVDPAASAQLHDIEREAVASAVPRRVSEFATGRVLLRELMAVDVAIPTDVDRSPRVPEPFRASLAHDDCYAAAAVTRDAGIAALGVDIEPTDPLEPGLEQVILRSDDARVDAHLAFTLKEAAFKAWSGIGGRMLEHHDVRLSISGSMFEAEVLPDGVRIQGRFAAAAGRWLALVVVPAPAAAPPLSG